MKLHPKSRILVIRLSAIGDVARTLSAVSLLRKHYPNAYIAWAVEEKSLPVLEGDPSLNEVILFPRKTFTQLSRNPANWFEFIRTWKNFVHSLQSHHFDIVLDFHGIFKSGLISFFSRAPIRIGYSRPLVKEWNWLFSNHKVTLSNPNLNRYDRNRALIEQWIPSAPSDPTPMYISLKDQEKIGHFLNEIKIKQSNGTTLHSVILHPGASKAHKQWQPEKFAQLADGLMESEKVALILTWGPGEKELAEKVKSLIKHKDHVFLAPDLNLKQFAELTSRIDLFISADSGPMHIAATMGANQIALFGPTDPKVNDPNNPKATLIKAKDFKNINAMQEIQVEEVLHIARLKLIQ